MIKRITAKKLEGIKGVRKKYFENTKLVILVLFFITNPLHASTSTTFDKSSVSSFIYKIDHFLIQKNVDKVLPFFSSDFRFIVKDKTGEERTYTKKEFERMLHFSKELKGYNRERIDPEIIFSKNGMITYKSLLKETLQIEGSAVINLSSETYKVLKVNMGFRVMELVVTEK
ncbi:MAG: hypothetical protein QNJ78_15780 [Gammaproteobacteria bacterium]|nr:hypothetical protein [Gammaproteobacteria bacterium]